MTNHVPRFITPAFRHSALSVLALFASVAGCSKAPDHPDVSPVKGVVTYHAKPVEGANVSFVGDGTARPAFGITDKDGKFQLSTFGEKDGAVPGPHKVSVTKSAAAASIDDGSMEAAEKRAKQPRVAPASAIPARYADWNTSQLEFTVSATSPNEFTIELKD